MPGVDESNEPRSQPGRRPQRPRWVAAGFLLAFALTVLTVILTGLFVRGPRSDAGDRPAEWPTAAGPDAHEAAGVPAEPDRERGRGRERPTRDPAPETRGARVSPP